MNTTRKATIVGTGMYAPERVVTNQYFNDLYKKDIGTFLSEQRNIRERRWMNPEQRTSDLILPAAEEAMKVAGITAKDLDLIIVSTDTPDYLSPSTASVVAYRLGAVNAGTYDINTACAGFVVGCDIASKYIAADSKYKNILVVGAYGMSKYLNFDDYKIASLFADGAGAVVLQPSKDSSGFIDSQMYTDGQYHDYMGIYAGGTAQPVSHQVIENKGHLLAFPKRIPPETNGIHWPRLTHQILDRIKKNPSDIQHFFITQFNVQSIYETMDQLSLPRERAHYVMDRYGYTGSASIGMAVADAAYQKKMKKGDLVFMLGSGGGMSMAALALEWGYDT
ncbi:ketoacyl-ACP synthase III [Bdellovibrio bacteriovorus]|uniref:ketoacyl-ACP synthase III n=1 Tax=Bdellovibrio bacteriovorus TaxID=959 RepID=UPI0021D3A977|nr:ketoacyl-ACP synthase III [Bdellovibrio bacteriovorus]UXR65486.1 ketoacyl-ACP synthase III [Bdellovibrio bacteriovorus]